MLSVLDLDGCLDRDFLLSSVLPYNVAKTAVLTTST